MELARRKFYRYHVQQKFQRSVEMPLGVSEDGRKLRYSRLTGFIYIFNLIVGTGALTLPAAFHNAGWALSTGVLIMLAFMSYLTTTYMVESMASANALLKFRKSQALKRSDSVSRDDQAESLSSSPNTPRRVRSSNQSILQRSNSSDEDEDEHEPLLSREESSQTEDDQQPDVRIAQGRLASREGRIEVSDRSNVATSSYYEITEIVEMGKMASLFFNKIGLTLFYLCIAIYLYGDLAIYSAAVAKSLRDVACTYKINSTNLTDSSPCWKDSQLSRMNAYRIFLTLFALVVGPFGFFNVTKTKYLQIFTTVLRWLAFGAMITLASIRLSRGQRANPEVAVFSGVPSLFGVCVYSFMCHHSLPSLITPIKNKQYISWLIASDFLLVMLFYLLLTFTGIFAFEEINDLYTLNFQPEPGDPWFLATVRYFLSLFPVFTLSTNFPIITITLRNNLKALFLTEGRRYSWWIRSCLFPLLALVPPMVVALITNNLEFLVGVTGSYSGAGIQYIVPGFLAYFSRKKTQAAIGVGIVNEHSSWFRSTTWIAFVQIWAIGCVVVVTYNHIASAVKN